MLVVTHSKTKEYFRGLVTYSTHTLLLESDYLLQILWYFAKKLCRKGRTMVRRRSGYDEIDGSVNSGEFDDVSDEEFFQDMMGYGRNGSSFDEI